MAQQPLHLTALAAAGAIATQSIHLAVGMFDGMHLGHRSVLEAAVQSARRCAGTAGMLTFWPHPSTLFRPESPTRLLQPMEMKIQMAGEWGVQWVITQRFDSALAALAAENFLPWLRGCLPKLEGIYVGENFRYGQGRRGDVPMLVAAGREQGVTIFSAPRVSIDGEPVSSTRIRALLTEGKISDAGALLGYTYVSEGTVQAGKKLGRALGFPTLNVAWNPELLPRYGVYAVRVYGENSTLGLPGVANYGVRPTVEKTDVPLLETHVLGEIGDLDAGSKVRVEWCEFLRPELKFASLSELRGQIARDRERASEIFS